jgi:hypothetical protein
MVESTVYPQKRALFIELLFCYPQFLWITNTNLSNLGQLIM